jgi:hypothetical protein
MAKSMRPVLGLWALAPSHSALCLAGIKEFLPEGTYTPFFDSQARSYMNLISKKPKAGANLVRQAAKPVRIAHQGIYGLRTYQRHRRAMPGDPLAR